MAPDCIGQEVNDMVGRLQEGQVLLLENVRFHPEEEKNDASFAKQVGRGKRTRLPSPYLHLTRRWVVCPAWHAAMHVIPCAVCLLTTGASVAAAADGIANSP